jgi:hypothetical protein
MSGDSFVISTSSENILSIDANDEAFLDVETMEARSLDVGGDVVFSGVK